MGAPNATLPLQRLEAGRDIAKTCVQFGFCTSVCPTYTLDGQENDSPRGRIALIRTMLDQGGVPTTETVTHIDRCLSCLSCTTTCAAGVNYRELVDTAREYIESSKVRPLPERALRSVLMRLLTSSRLLSLSLRLGRPLMPWMAKRSGRLGAIAKLSQAPALAALNRRENLNEGLEHTSAPATLIEPNTVDTTPATTIRHRVALLDGCAQSAIGPEINQATRRLLKRLGVAIVMPPKLRADACCGALPLHMGKRKEAAAMAAPWVDAWSQMLDAGEIDAILITTSGCGSVIKHYADIFNADDPRYAAAVRVSKHALDISEFVAQIELPKGTSHLGARLAYHDACSLKHGQKLTKAPRQVLRSLGFDIVEPGESHLCCGSAGTYNLLQPEIADRLGKRKAQNLIATQADAIVAGNLGCLVQISRFTGIPIAHWVQLVDWGTGGPAPIGLEKFEPRLPATSKSDFDVGNLPNAAIADTSSDCFW